MWMDPCGSLVLFPPGSPVELDICKLAWPPAAFKGYQLVGEWGEAGVQAQLSEQLCVCVGGWWGAGLECGEVLRPPDWARSLRFKFQRYVCLLTHVDLFQLLFPCRWRHVMCICTPLCVWVHCRNVSVYVCAWLTVVRGNPMHPSATTAASTWRTVYICATAVFSNTRQVKSGTFRWQKAVWV